MTDLAHVSEGDPHAAAHNAERDAINDARDLSSRLGPPGTTMGLICYWSSGATEENADTYCATTPPFPYPVRYGNVNDQYFTDDHITYVDIADWNGFDVPDLAPGIAVTVNGLYTLDLLFNITMTPFSPDPEPDRFFEIYAIYIPAGSDTTVPANPKTLQLVIGTTNAKTFNPAYGNSTEHPNIYSIKSSRTVALRAGDWLGIAADQQLHDPNAAATTAYASWTLTPLLTETSLLTP